MGAEGATQIDSLLGPLHRSGVISSPDLSALSVSSLGSKTKESELNSLKSRNFQTLPEPTIVNLEGDRVPSDPRFLNQNPEQWSDLEQSHTIKGRIDFINSMADRLEDVISLLETYGNSQENPSNQSYQDLLKMYDGKDGVKNYLKQVLFEQGRGRIPQLTEEIYRAAKEAQQRDELPEDSPLIEDIQSLATRLNTLYQRFDSLSGVVVDQKAYIQLETSSLNDQSKENPDEISNRIISMQVKDGLDTEMSQALAIMTNILNQSKQNGVTTEALSSLTTLANSVLGPKIERSTSPDGLKQEAQEVLRSLQRFLSQTKEMAKV